MPMHVASLHPWDLTPAQAIALQVRLAPQIREGVIALPTLRYVGGADVSASKDSPLLTAGIVVWDRLENRLVEAVWAQTEETFPYVPGLLSFIVTKSSGRLSGRNCTARRSTFLPVITSPSPMQFLSHLRVYTATDSQSQHVSHTCM